MAIVRLFCTLCFLFTVVVGSDQGRGFLNDDLEIVGFRNGSTEHNVLLSDEARFRRSVVHEEKVVVSESPSIRRCYQFTWPGELENNTMKVDWKKASKLNPYFLPFVITNDSSIPDPKIVYDYCKHRGIEVTCKLTADKTCIRYTYFKGNKPSNISWFCGSVQDTTDDKVLKQGENSQLLRGGERRAVAFCQDDLCNSAAFLFSKLWLFLVVFSFILP